MAEDLAFMICMTTLTIYIQMATKVWHGRTIIKISVEDHIVVREFAACLHLQVFGGKIQNSSIEDLAFMIYVQPRSQFTTSKMAKKVRLDHTILKI